MKAESHVVWSTKKEIDLGDPSQKKTYIQDVLTNGLAPDISKKETFLELSRKIMDRTKEST